MDAILVTGGSELNGEIPIAGAKNACLTLMPATLLSEEPLTLTNAPRLSDIKDYDDTSRKFWFRSVQHAGRQSAHNVFA